MNRNITARRARDVERVPGLRLVISSNADVKILWPSGYVSAMGWFPLFDHAHYEEYCAHPLLLSKHDQTQINRKAREAVVRSTQGRRHR